MDRRPEPSRRSCVILLCVHRSARPLSVWHRGARSASGNPSGKSRPGRRSIIEARQMRQRTGLQMAHRLSGQSGSSLLELFVAMAASLIVLGATLQCLSSFQREFARQQHDIGQEQDVRLSLELLQQELRLASAGSLSIARPDAVEFTANVNGLTTNVTAPGEKGHTTLAVADGREWPESKTVEVCWNDQCDRFTLARPGQRYVLTFVEPVARPIPTGASVMVMNRIRYYSRLDERGRLRCL